MFLFRIISLAARVNACRAFLFILPTTHVRQSFQLGAEPGGTPGNNPWHQLQSHSDCGERNRGSASIAEMDCEPTESGHFGCNRLQCCDEWPLGQFIFKCPPILWWCHHHRTNRPNDCNSFVPYLTAVFEDSVCEWRLCCRCRLRMAYARCWWMQHVGTLWSKDLLLAWVLEPPFTINYSNMLYDYLVSTSLCYYLAVASWSFFLL